MKAVGHYSEVVVGKVVLRVAEGLKDKSAARRFEHASGLGEQCLRLGQVREDVHQQNAVHRT
jgi:hypothetical protein